MGAAAIREDFANALHDALAVESPTDSIARIKAIAASEIRNLDPRAQLTATSYFNHSFVPDFLLSWSTGPVQERQVFLRFAQDGAAISRDLRRIASLEPTVVALEALSLSPEEEATLDSQSVESGALVFDQAGLSPLVQAVETGDAFAGLYASAMAQSGRGLQAGTRATEALHDVEKSYEGSLEGDPDATRSGLRRISEVLKPAAAGPLRQLLEAAWSGASPFPETVDAVSQLNDESIRWLLDLGDRADIELWRRVARKTDLAQLERVAPTSFSRPFQHLVAASLPHLHAKAALVTDRVWRATDDEDAQVQWTREGDLLALDIEKYRILLGSSIERVRARASAVGEDLPTVLDLAERGISLSVPKLKVDGEDFDIEAVAKERGATETRTDLERAADYLPATSRVGNLEVAVPAGGRLAVDFRRRLSTSVAASNPYMSEVARVSALLLCDPSDTFDAALRETLPVHSSPIVNQGELDLEDV